MSCIRSIFKNAEKRKKSKNKSEQIKKKSLKDKQINENANDCFYFRKNIFFPSTFDKNARAHLLIHFGSHIILRKENNNKMKLKNN